MPWFYVDDAFADAKPVMQLDRGLRNEAIGLWLRCGAWSAKEETDGRVPLDVVKRFDGTPRLIRALHDQAELWSPESAESWQKSREILFKNWEKWQKTRAENIARRKREADKKSTYRSAKKGRDYVATSDDEKMSTRDTTGDTDTDSKNVSTRDTPGESLYPDPTRPLVVTDECVSPVSSGPAPAHTPSPFCDKHPNGTRDRCGDCGNARNAFKAWQRDQDEREQHIADAVEANRRAIRDAIDDCDDCDDFGRLDDLSPCPKHPGLGDGRRHA